MEKTVKLIGITVDRRLSFELHLNKVYTKIPSLYKNFNLISQEKLKMIMGVFVKSKFSYCPLMWMCNSSTMNNKINTLQDKAPQEKALKEQRNYNRKVFLCSPQK